MFAVDSLSAIYYRRRFSQTPIYRLDANTTTSPKRRAVLLVGAGAVGFGALGYRELTDCEESACFAFEY